MAKLTNPLLLVPLGGAALGTLAALLIIFAIGGGGQGEPSLTPTATGTPIPAFSPSATSTATFTATATTTVTPTATAPPTSRVPLGELIKRAKAFVTARGYYPYDPILTDDGRGRHLLAFPSLCSWVVTGNHVNCQATYFFLEDTYLGSDTFYAYYGYEHVRLLGSGRFAIDYRTYAPDDPECCPSVEGTVIYTWTGDKLVASGEPPRPRGQPFGGMPVSAPQSLYVAVYGYEDKHWFRFEGERVFLPAGTAVTIELVNTDITGARHALAIPEISFRSADTTAGSPISFQVSFDTPGTYTFHCPYHPEQGQGVIEVVPPLRPLFGLLGGAR